MTTERIGTTDVRFRRRGRGDRALVFVHGFLDDQYVWEPLTAELTTAGVEYVTLDLAGCGDRTAASGPFGYDRFADDVGAVVDTLGKPFVIVGQSMGAAVAELVAAERPERARGLVLLTPVPLAGTRLPEAELDRLVVSAGRMRPAVVHDFADCWNTGHPAGEQPSRFSGPVLILRGEEDGFVTEEVVSGKVAPRFPSVESVSVGGGGHWIHLEQPAEVAGHLDRFLATTLPSGGSAPPGTVTPQGWTSAFAEKSSAAFGQAFAPDVVLEASVLTRPIEGRDQVKSVMGAASGIYESLAFTQQAINGSRTYLEWEATAFGGMRLDGVTILTKDESGRIVRAAIHHRPLGAVHRFSAELRTRLHGVVEADHFHQG
ncbi:alpha/beta fold hydrolase [Streptomyces sp. NPDC001070]